MNVPAWISECDFGKVLVEFGGSTATQILDPDLVHEFDKRLHELLGMRDRVGNGFPGSLAVSIMRDDLRLIEENDYHILLKSDGIRYWLFAFGYEDKNGVWRNLVDMIDRSYTHHIVTAAFTKPVFHGTVFDGELVNTTNGWEFQIFDCLAVKGEYMAERNHISRMTRARNCIEEEYKYVPLKHSFNITVKPYVTPDQALSVLYERTETFPIDGWILIDETRPYIYGKDTSLFKYKLLEDHTIDLKLYDRNDTLCLCVIDNGKLEPVQSPSGIDSECLKTLGVSEERMLSGYILECRWNNKLKKWIPIKKRFDKDIPNNRTTYNLTIRNIEENITAVQMFNLLKKKESL